MAVLPPLRFSVSLETIFRDKPFEQRLEYIADLGFTAFEFWSRQGKDMNITLALKTALRLDIAAIGGSDVSMVDPDQRAAFLNDLTRTAALAVDLSCANLVVYSGPALPNMAPAEQRKQLVETLQQAAAIAADADVTVVLEPRNASDHPGSFLTSSQTAAAIIREVNHPNARLLFNLYHQQISEGNLSANLTECLDVIGHIRVADVPGGHEPGTGEINYEHIFGLLREKSYGGYVGLDYTPLYDSAASLRAVRALSQ